jgi:hypothetical protein
MLFFLPCKYVLTTHSVLHHQDYKRAYERFSDGLEMDPENAEMEDAQRYPIFLWLHISIVCLSSAFRST